MLNKPPIPVKSHNVKPARRPSKVSTMVYEWALCTKSPPREKYVFGECGIMLATVQLVIIISATATVIIRRFFGYDKETGTYNAI